MKKRIAIDIVPIRVGEGGTGSGIWTYARELIHHMDQYGTDGLEVVCFVNREQIPYLSGLRCIQLICFPWFGKNILFRLLWIHLVLPLTCLFRRVKVLHKLATETPFFCPAKRVTTVCDFYYEYLFENHPKETIRLYERLENVYFSIISRICFYKSSAVIAISDATRMEAVRRYPAAAGRILTIHLSAASSPPSPDAVSPAQNPQPEIFNILCVAKFMEHKGQHLLIEAFEELLTANPGLAARVQLSLRGFHNDRDYFLKIKQRVDGSRWGQRIQIIPFNPADSCAEIYREASLVVLLSSYEGFGLPVLEAQSAGIPVLCSDLPVLREVGGDGAVFVGRENEQAVVDAMKRLIVDADFYETVRTAAAVNLRRFSWETAARQTLDVYRQIS
jgi:glycosyltransferase involved in cell wall biosynthesis